jgi:DNA replication protein DnaC
MRKTMARNPKLATPELPDPRVVLVQLAMDLDLTALAAALPELLDQAEKESPSFSAFAQRVFEVEAKARRERKLSRGLKRSRLGAIEGLEGFDFARRPGLDPRVVRELLSLGFMKGEWKRNVICVGRPGLGKTRVAKAIVHAACVAGYSTLCVVTSEMIEHLHASQADGTFKRALERYLKPNVLLLDEWGHQTFDSKAVNYVFRVVSGRHGKGSIVLTSNCGFTQWKRFFPSEPQAAATIDRLVDQAPIRQIRYTRRAALGAVSGFWATDAEARLPSIAQIGWWRPREAHTTDDGAHNGRGVGMRCA